MIFLRLKLTSGRRGGVSIILRARSVSTILRANNYGVSTILGTSDLQRFLREKTCFKLNKEVCLSHGFLICGFSVGLKANAKAET